MSLRLKLLAGTATIGAVAWLPIASVAIAAAKHVLAHLDAWVVPFAWFFFWRDYGDVPSVSRLLTLTGAGSAVLAFGPALAVACMPIPKPKQLRPARPGVPPPAPVRAHSDLHGHADWLSEQRLARLAVAPMPAHGGVVYGTACRGDLHPEDNGGNAALLRETCLQDATHGHVYFGSGGGKTSTVVIPTLDPEVGWRANLLVNDPSSQAGSMCAAMRRKCKQRVVFLGPRDGTRSPRVGMNVLGWIDAADPMFEEHIWSAVDSLGREVSAKEAESPNGMFKMQGKSLQAAILADMMADPDMPASLKTPRLFAERVATPENKMKGRLATIHASSNSRMARLLAGTLMQTHPKTFSGFCVEATADLRWLLTEVYADLVSSTAPGSLSADEFVRGNVCAFLQLGVTTMENTPQVGRAILNALLNAVYRAEGRTSRKYLLLLDEMNLFGRLKALSTVASQGRKYGITLVGFWHSLSQMTETWGEDGAETWRANASWEAFSAMNTATAKDVSERCGTYTVVAPSEGRSTSNQSGSGQGSRSRGDNTSISLQPRKLITADEAERGLGAGQQIVFRRDQPDPLRILKASYYLRPGMAAKVGQDQYQQAAE